MGRRHVAGGTIAVVGLTLAMVQIQHAVVQTRVPLAQIVEAGPFAMLGLSIVFVGYWLTSAEHHEPDAYRVLAWGGGGLVLFLSVSALILFGQNVATDSLSRGAYVAADLATVGAVAGVVVGLYDARSREQTRAVAEQRDRVQTFANKAADVNNYGRALNQCATPSEVAALLIQAVQALLDLDETAVLEGADGGFRVVESTITAVPDSALASVAERTADAEPATVETFGTELPPDVATRTDTVVGLLVSDTTGPPVVILAFGDGRTIADETVQLFELLAAHAGTALDGIYASAGSTSPDWSG